MSFVGHEVPPELLGPDLILPRDRAAARFDRARVKSTYVVQQRS